MYDPIMPFGTTQGVEGQLTTPEMSSKVTTTGAAAYQKHRAWGGVGKPPYAGIEISSVCPASVTSERSTSWSQIMTLESERMR